MLNLLKPKRLATAVTLCAAMLLHASAWAQAPAELAPADTKMFIHIQKPASWFADLTQGPFGQKWRDAIQQAQGSGDLLAALGMDTNQFMNAYFGSDVVILSKGKDNDGQEGPGVIFTKVTQDKRAHAIESLALKLQGDLAGNPVYTGEDGDGFIVMMKDWVAMCDLDAFEYLESILTQADDAPRLAGTEAYALWTRELPADRVMTMLAFESELSQHAMGIVRQGKGMDATYLGISPNYDNMIAALGEASITDFGPLPADTISAITMNLKTTDASRPDMEKLNMLLNGKSFADEVLPKLASPTVMFMSSIPGDIVEPAVDVEVPVAGMAFKMKDTSVASDMDLMFDNLVMLANVAVMGFEAGLIPQRSADYNGSGFKVAELGKPIAQGMGFPELASMQIVYGRVGDYYVVCSQEQFFKQCLDADKAGTTLRVGAQDKPHRLAQTPVLAMTARPDRFGSLMLSWVQMLDDKGLAGAAGREGQSMQPEDLVQMMQQYAQMKMQLWTGEDGLVIGRAQLIAQE